MLASRVAHVYLSTPSEQLKTAQTFGYVTLMSSSCHTSHLHLVACLSCHCLLHWNATTHISLLWTKVPCGFTSGFARFPGENFVLFISLVASWALVFLYPVVENIDVERSTTLTCKSCWCWNFPQISRDICCVLEHWFLVWS